MAFSTQQTNSTTRLLTALAELKEAYYECIEQKDAAALIGIPLQADFPGPGDLDHLTRPRIVLAHGVVEALKTWMTTPIDLDGVGSLPSKAPLDAIVEALR
jgi:hypothetical protein